jgi:hypothetical protein
MTNVWSDLCNVGADLKPRAYTDIYSGPRLSAPMPNLQPEQATLALHVALPAIQREHQTTRSVIEAIPLDNGDYRPEPVAKTALELAWHIVAAEHRFYSAVAAGEFDFTPRHRPEDVKNSADIGKFYGESFAKRAIGQGDRFPRDDSIAGGGIPRSRIAALDSSPWAVVGLLASGWR